MQTCGSAASYAFFPLFLSVASFIFLNLATAVLLRWDVMRMGWVGGLGDRWAGIMRDQNEEEGQERGGATAEAEVRSGSDWVPPADTTPSAGYGVERIECW